MTTGTLVDIKRLSWEGTKVRANQVLEARKLVRNRPQGSIPGCVPPIHVKSLLEEMMPQIAKGDAWIRKLHSDLAYYRNDRLKSRRDKQAAMLASITKTVTA
jgi:hypothetical protein